MLVSVDLTSNQAVTANGQGGEASLPDISTVCTRINVVNPACSSGTLTLPVGHTLLANGSSEPTVRRYDTQKGRVVAGVHLYSTEYNSLLLQLNFETLAWKIVNSATGNEETPSVPFAIIFNCSCLITDLGNSPTTLITGAY